MKPKEIREQIEKDFREWLSEFFCDDRAFVCLHWDASFAPAFRGVFAVNCKDCDTKLVDFNEFLRWVRRTLKLSDGNARLVVGDTEYQFNGTELLACRCVPIDLPWINVTITKSGE